MFHSHFNVKQRLFKFGNLEADNGILFIPQTLTCLFFPFAVGKTFRKPELEPPSPVHCPLCQSAGPEWKVGLAGLVAHHL